MIEYLQHTLKFIPWNDSILDAWTELLKILNGRLKEFSDHPEEDLKLFLGKLNEDTRNLS